MSLNELQIEGITQLMTTAGRLMLSAGGIDSRRWAVADKAGSENFVTEYDVAVQNLLVDGFSELIPDCKFLAEEENCQNTDINKGICFVIDPIDGTTNFIHGLNASSISVGVLEDGVPSFGAVYDPYRKEIFTAQVGCGAYLNGKKISVSQTKFKHAIVMMGTSPYYKDTLGERTAELMKNFLYACGDIRRGGSAAIDLCQIACGRADVFYEMKLSPWDFTASWVIIEEAGGRISDMQGNPLIPGQPSSIFASNGICFNNGIELINQK